MEAIILVGGKGTRLGELTKNTPKPMLPIRDRPFLERLLEHLKINGFERVILAVGYKSEKIIQYFNSKSSKYPDIIMSIEDRPLGTGGALKEAIQYVDTNNVFVLNGDSFVDVDYKNMLEDHVSNNYDISIAGTYTLNAQRYGVMRVDDQFKIESFDEKGINTEGIINTGVYLIDVKKIKKLFVELNLKEFSFEKNVLEKNIPYIEKKCYLVTKGYFIDIGIPEDYMRAQTELFI